MSLKTDKQQLIADEMSHRMQMIWSDEEFNLMLKEMTQAMEETLVEAPSKGISPSLIAVCKKQGTDHLEHVYVTLDDFRYEDTDARHKLYEVIGAKFAKEGYSVLCVFNVSEAWSSVRSEEEMKKIDTEGEEFVKPSKHPNRQEVVMIVGQTLDKRLNGTTINIERLKDDIMFPKKVEVREYTEDCKVKFSSNLLDSFYKGFAAYRICSQIEEMGINPEAFLKNEKKGKNEKTVN